MEQYERLMQDSKEHREAFQRVATRLQIVNPEEDKQHTASMSKPEPMIEDAEDDDNCSIEIGGSEQDFSLFQQEYMNA